MVGYESRDPLPDFDSFYRIYIKHIFFFQKIRKYKRKSDRGTWSVKGIIAAMHSVRNDCALCYVAASMYGVPGTTLRRYLKKNE